MTDIDNLTKTFGGFGIKEANPRTYEKVQEDYIKHLKPKGVKNLGERSILGQALCCLYESIGKPVHIDKITEYVKANGITLRGGNPLQVRHIALQYGYNMLKELEIHPETREKIPKFHFMLVDMENRCPSYMPKRRDIQFTDTEWENLKKEYDNMCVNCGSKEGEPMRWQKSTTTLLQKGHMDPRKPLVLSNVIPQCAFCNQRCKDKKVFDKRGDVIEILN
jgi:organic radical activating enzyme